MMVSKIVERKDLPQTLEDWLVANNMPLSTPLELFFLPGEVVIRPQPDSQQEILEWFESFRQRYDDVLRQLATGEIET